MNEKDKMYSCNNDECSSKFKWRALRDRHLKEKCKFKCSVSREKVMDKFNKTDDGFQCKTCLKIVKVSTSTYKHVKGIMQTPNKEK